MVKWRYKYSPYESKSGYHFFVEESKDPDINLDILLNNVIHNRKDSYHELMIHCYRLWDQPLNLRSRDYGYYEIRFTNNMHIINMFIDFVHQEDCYRVDSHGSLLISTSELQKALDYFYRKCKLQAFA